MSINFRISLSEIRKTFPLFIVSSGTNYELVAKPPSKGCGSLFRVIGLPVYLATNAGFYLGLKYYIQVNINDAGDFRYLQLNADNSYTPVASANENCFGVIFYDECAEWNSCISLGKCDLDQCHDKKMPRRGLRFLNYYPENGCKCKEIPSGAIFRRDDLCEKERLVFSITECTTINNCTVCGLESCPVDTVCAGGNCTQTNPIGISSVGFSLRATNVLNCPVIITYDFYEKGKCCCANTKGDVKLRMRFVPVNSISASDADPYNSRLQLFYADGPFEVGKVSPIFVVQNLMKKYLTNPVIGEDRKGIYTEYSLNTTPGCHSLAFKPKHNGNWNTYIFKEKDFCYLQIPDMDCNYCEEKGGKDRVELPLPKKHSFKIPFMLSSEMLEEAFANSNKSKEKGYISETSPETESDSEKVIFIESSSPKTSTGTGNGFIEETTTGNITTEPCTNTQSKTKSKSKRTESCSDSCSKSSSSCSSSSSSCSSSSSSCSSSSNDIKIALWSNISKDGISVVPSNPVPTPSPGTNPLTPLIPSNRPTPNPAPNPAPTPNNNSWTWATWLFVGLAALFLIIIISILVIYYVQYQRPVPVVVKEQRPLFQKDNTCGFNKQPNPALKTGPCPPGSHLVNT